MNRPMSNSCTMRSTTSTYSNDTAPEATSPMKPSPMPSASVWHPPSTRSLKQVGEFREQHFGDDWKIIWATRNRIAHGYTYIDLAIIRDSVEHDLPEFEHLLRTILT